MIVVTAFADQDVAVLGLGRSGRATALALMAGGTRVHAWDDDAARREAAEVAGIPLTDPTTLDWSRIVALVPSPGVPLTHPAPHPVIVQAQAAGTEIIGDIELLVRSRRAARIVAVTGTNGKSTTTALIGHMLGRDGRRVEIGGNLGRPALDLEPLGADGIYILELSSYQLALATRFAPDIAVWLNISPDHLDRHGDMAGYVAAKRKIFGRTDGVAVLGIDDELSFETFKALDADGGRHLVPVSLKLMPSGGVCVEGGVLRDVIGDDAWPVVDLRLAQGLRGVHNWQNAACAFAAARALGVPSAVAGGAIISFPGLAHRMEPITTLNGIPFINDSKATNAQAAAQALACFDNIYWIVGGRPKDGGIDTLAPLFSHIAHAFLIGEAADAFARTLKGRVAVTRSGDLESAVRDAAAAATANPDNRGVVLLSPACASFDQWSDFEARGDAFRDAVNALTLDASGPAPADHRRIAS